MSDEKTPITDGTSPARTSEPVEPKQPDALDLALGEAEQAGTVAVEKRRTKGRPVAVAQPRSRGTQKETLPVGGETSRAAYSPDQLETARKTIAGFVAGTNTGIVFGFQRKCERAELPEALAAKIVSRVPLSDAEQAQLSEYLTDLAQKWGIINYVGPELGGISVLAPWVLSLFMLWREIDRLEKRPEAAPVAPVATVEAKQ